MVFQLIVVYGQFSKTKLWKSSVKIIMKARGHLRGCVFIDLERLSLLFSIWNPKTLVFYSFTRQSKVKIKFELHCRYMNYSLMIFSLQNCRLISFLVCAKKTTREMHIVYFNLTFSLIIIKYLMSTSYNKCIDFLYKIFEILVKNMKLNSMEIPLLKLWGLDLIMKSKGEACRLSKSNCF